jgi:hypothetical protein
MLVKEGIRKAKKRRHNYAWTRSRLSAIGRREVGLISQRVAGEMAPGHTPHYIVLIFLWIVCVIVTVIAFFAILFTGRYPRNLFDFNVGALRWTWGVSFYSYSALAADQYLPFTMKHREYPATLQVKCPEWLSRGLVLVKRWPPAIPHFAIVGSVPGWLGTSL